MKKILFILLLISQSVSAQQKCTDKNLPIVFVHGFMGSGDNWATQIQRFSSNGFCEDKLFVFDWNSIGGGSTTSTSLNKFIDGVLKKTNATLLVVVFVMRI